MSPPMESSVNDMVKGRIHAITAHLAIKRGLLHIISTHSDVFISSITDEVVIIMQRIT